MATAYADRACATVIFSSSTSAKCTRTPSPASVLAPFQDERPVEIGVAEDEGVAAGFEAHAAAEVGFEQLTAANRAG